MKYCTVKFYYVGTNSCAWDELLPLSLLNTCTNNNVATLTYATYINSLPALFDS